MYRTVGQGLLYVAVLGVLGAGIWGLYVWSQNEAADADHHEPSAPVAAEQPVKLSLAAQKNLGLVSKPLALTNHWRTIDVPGVIVDRPGVSDRGVVAPVAGIVTRIFRYPGDAVDSGAPLFRIRLVSESLHASQLELFKATREIQIAREERQRLATAAEGGALPRARLIEIDNQIRRLQVNEEAYRQDLLARGLPSERIAAAARGEFVTEIEVAAPTEQATANAAAEGEPQPVQFEIHELKVELGQQVDAGALLCRLADHRQLLIEGRGFKDDLPLVQQAANRGFQIKVEYELPGGDDWPQLPESLQIEHVANVIDVDSRTFAFYLPLVNQWKSFERDGQSRFLWRFRPGDRVRLHVDVEEFQQVFVLPHDAVVRHQGEASVYRQNGLSFTRRSVRVLYEDRREVVIANDGSLREGWFIAQKGAASILRVGQTQAASGQPGKKLHVHADGTVHEEH
jgi:biotin carboxyl carrier protein